MGEILARAEARIEEPALAQSPPCLEIVRPALALGVGAEGATTIGAFSPANSEPMQVFQHSLDKFGARALGIKVLVAEDQSSMIFEGTLVGDPEGAGMAKVKQTGRRGREASAIRLARGSGRGDRGVTHKGILAGGAVVKGCVFPARVPCPTGVYACAHGCAARSRISRDPSIVSSLAVILRYHLRLRQPQRR